MKKYRFLVALILFIVATTTLCGCKNNDFLKVNSKNVNEYQIDITVDEINHTAKAIQSVDYINNTDNALDYVCFHLYPNSFAEDVKNKPVSVLYENRAYPNGESFGNITIESVVSHQGILKFLQKEFPFFEKFPQQTYPTLKN